MGTHEFKVGGKPVISKHPIQGRLYNKPSYSCNLIGSCL